MKLVKLSVNDIEIIKELFLSVFTQEPWNDDWSDEDQLTRYLLDIIDNHNSLSLGYYNEDGLIAIALGHIKHWYEGTEYCIDELCVKTELQKQGVGASFLSDLEECLLRQDIKHLFLLTDRDVPAYSFYKKHGFTELTRNVAFTKRIIEQGSSGENINIMIRKVKQGDEKILAHIQTESWKAAFARIVAAELLEKCTEITRAENMYAKLLDEGKGNGYVLEINGQAHCIAYWDVSREKDMPGYAELICIHSLQDRWHKGYGSQMMERVLRDIKNTGFEKVMLWVFEENIRAISFYKKHGFVANDKRQEAFGSIEVMYEKSLY